MTNVVPIGNTSRGFTRMDNELYEALIGADLSRRDLKAAMVIHRLTAGYNVSEARIAASVIADMAGMDRTQASKAICSLIEQRVVYRVGGSRGKLGMAQPSSWRIIGKPTEHTCAQSARIVSLSEHTYAHNKDSKDITTTDVVVSAPQAKPEPEAEKPKAKRDTFTLSNLLSDNPHGVSEQVLSDWLTCRKKLRAAVTATVWKRVNSELAKCVAMGISADDALAEAQEAGWRGFKAEWLLNRSNSSRQFSQAARPSSVGPDFHSGDTSWAHDLGDDL